MSRPGFIRFLADNEWTYLEIRCQAGAERKKSERERERTHQHGKNARFGATKRGRTAAAKRLTIHLPPTKIILFPCEIAM